MATFNITQDGITQSFTVTEGIGPAGPPASGPVMTVTAGDELEIISDGITYYVPLYRRP